MLLYTASNKHLAYHSLIGNLVTIVANLAEITSNPIATLFHHAISL